MTGGFSHPVQKKVLAQTMRDSGVSVNRVAIILGVYRTTVRRWTEPEFNERERQRSAEWRRNNKERRRRYHRHYDKNRRRRGTCTQCGGQMAVAYERDGVCKRCIKANQHFRRTDIQRMWNDLRLRPGEIAERLGTTRIALNAEVHRMREDGWLIMPANRQRAPR